MNPRTPSIPGQDIQQKFYGESFASERLQILQKAREIAKENIDRKQQECKEQYDKNARNHDFSIGQQVWYLETDFIGKNKKLAPKYRGLAIIVHVNESIAMLKSEKNKLKTVNVNKLKHFFPDEDPNTENNAENNTNATKQSNLIKSDPKM